MWSRWPQTVRGSSDSPMSMAVFIIIENVIDRSAWFERDYGMESMNDMLCSVYALHSVEYLLVPGHPRVCPSRIGGVCMQRV